MSPSARPIELGEAVDRSAAPATVQTSLQRLRDRRPDFDELVRTTPDLGHALVAVFAASRSLTRVILGHAEALGVLATLDTPVPPDALTTERLVTWQRLEMLRLAARDLLELDDLETTTAGLADLASGVLRGAAELAAAMAGRGHTPIELAVIAMGKLGGRELNYASDVDVLFVGDGPRDELDRRARAVIDIARRCYRIDTTLRPEGRDGALVRSIDSYEAYWDRWAQPWEFQALLKARAVAGDVHLGKVFDDTAARWLWTYPFAADQLRDLRRMKQRAEAEVARRGLTDRDLKNGRGGIRDIEFTLQLLQLVHGHLDLDLRSPTTLVTLAEMASAGYIDPPDADDLATAYRFLRTVEHRLQLEDEQQVHAIPDDPGAVDHLARVLGYRDEVRATAARQLEEDLLDRQLTVRLIHERVYFRPLLEAFAGAQHALSTGAAMTRLEAFGFTDAERTRTAVTELTQGLNRSSRLMQQFLPLILDWLSRTPNPDLGLLMLRNLLSGEQRSRQLVDAFRDSPESAQRTCTILGTSRLIGDVLIHNPDLVARLPDATRLQILNREELVASAIRTIEWRASVDDQQPALKRWNARHLAGIAARDILELAEVETVGADLTALADASTEAALTSLEPRVPFAVIAMGRFGGSELSYASDLDLLFVYEPGELDMATAADEALRVAAGIRRVLGGATPALRIYEIDPGLRPEGRHGPLARSLDGFIQYWRNYALVWERQAMIRARPVAGDVDLGTRLLEAIAPYVWDDPVTPDDVREIRRMKARIERERIPFGEDPQFHLKLGRGSLSDIEFTAQLLQLQHGVRATGTMRALAELAAHGAIAEDDAEALMTSYRFCERTRNRWFLVSSKPGNSMPTAPQELRWLARSLDLESSELRETYRRVTRRARRVVERVFYGN